METKVAKKPRKKLISPGMRLFIVILPFLAMYVIFNYLPLEGWRYAFYNYKPGLKLSDCEFVGFQHFTSMFENVIVRRQTFRAIRNTVVMSLLGFVTSYLPMFFAILLSELPSARLKKIIQTVTTIPNFVSWVIVFSLAFAMFSSENGVINTVMMNMGLIDAPINFLATDKNVYLSQWLWGNWKGIGWSAVIYLSALSGIDQELYEAASIDGANRFQKIRFITIPGLLPTYITLLILSIGNFLNNGMDMQFVFSNSFNMEYMENIDLYVFNLGIGGGQTSLSVAVGMMKSIIGLLLLFLSNAISGKVREEKIF